MNLPEIIPDQCFNFPSSETEVIRQGVLTLRKSNEVYTFFLDHLASYSFEDGTEHCTLTLHFPTHLVGLRGPPREPLTHTPKLSRIPQKLNPDKSPHWMTSVLTNGGEWTEAASNSAVSTTGRAILSEILVRRQPEYLNE